MRAPLAAQQLALAGLALLAAVAALAVVAQTRGSSGSSLQAVGDYTALAGSSGPGVLGRRTACGVVIGADTEGIAHPTLPCGARIFVTFDGRTVLAQVIDRGPYEAGRQFDLTDALARRLQLHGVQLVHWSYVRGH
jgi:rare lipoprotein A (peptidoglycan hydrolase)